MDGSFLNLIGATRMGRNLGGVSARFASKIGIDPAETPEERRAKRKKAGVIFGAIGVVFLLVIGEPAGSILFGFFFFGLLGWLAAPFLPSQFFEQWSKGSAK